MATLGLTVTPLPDSTPPGVRLDITASGTPTVTSATVTRMNQGGQTYPVRTSDGAATLPVSGGVATIFDYEIPYGPTATYSVAATGATTVTATASVDSDVPWLTHVGVPGLSMPFTVSTVPDLSRTTERGVFKVLERGDPIVSSSGSRSWPTGTLGVLTQSDAERTALGDLLDDGSPLFLNIPTSKGWGIDSCYISVAVVTEARVSRVAVDPWRTWSLPFQVVGRPAGGSQALRSWDTVYTSNGSPTWAALYTALGSPTWAQLANP